MDSAKYFDMLTNGTYITNVNNGVIQTNDYFGTKTIQGMALNLGSLYNKSSNFQADMTKAQSNYMSPNKVNT
jgi:hypothetical protein|tara:strand:- start:942 stop:1157 length:216 start_codon:yes stop_codon:yes gene_type:complete